MGTLKVWTNADMPEEAWQALCNGLEGTELVRAEATSGNLAATGPSASLNDCDIAFGQPDPVQTIEVSGLRWVHLTSAGYTRYDRDDLKGAFRESGRMLTNSSSVFDEPCAQHLLAFMLAASRELPRAFEAQLRGPKWVNEEIRSTGFLLRGQRVLVLGYGAIAKRLLEMLAPFQMEVVALRRSVSGHEAVAVEPIDALLTRIGEADHVVNTLPANSSTERLIGAEAFAAIKPGAFFYNIGRGTTVDQAALKAALDSERVRGAYLDVTDPEPLPADDPLWRAPNCWITPHIGGGFAGEHLALVRHFLANFDRYSRGEGLADVVF